jgi:serine/threonine protein kinase, bacterial
LWVAHDGAEQLLWEGSLPEDSFGNYQLIELLGRGGMGEVWRAHDTVIDRIVAIKILPAEISKDEVFQQRFRREAHAAARLRSPHIVPIHTHGEIDGRLFVEMGLIEGRDLQSILDVGPIPPARAVAIIEQIAKALNAAHKVGLLHRDVKPSNILIDDDGDAYLIDFGIALAVGDRGLTTVGDVIGTFHYMAPERFKTQDPAAPPIDARSDIYALACVLFECLTAEHAFRGDSLEQQIGNHLVSPPPRPSATNPALPRGFDSVIAKGMAKKPSERYETAVELARAARNAVTAPAPLPPRPPEPRPPVRRPLPPPPPPPQPVVPPVRVDNYGRRPTPPLPPAPLIPGSKNPSGANTMRGPAVNPNLRREAAVAQQVGTPIPPAPRSSPPPWWRRKGGVITAAALLTVAIVVGVVAISGQHGSEPDNPRLSTLPFGDLRGPQGLSVDRSGTVYVADTDHHKVLSWHQGAAKAEPLLQFGKLNYPSGVTADSGGKIYVNDSGHSKVLVLLPGAKEATVLPFGDLDHPTGLSVDNSSGTVYVTETGKNRVLALAPGQSQPNVVTGFTDLKEPTGLVVGPDGSVYVADGGHHQVLKLAPGAAQSVVPFTDLQEPGGLTVDNKGNVYVTDIKSNRVLKLPVGSTRQVDVNFPHLDGPWGLAVDDNGAVYVADRSDKIRKLMPS